MILKNIRVQNFGPFAVPADIEISPNVTVLTGQNDAGKSAVLRLIELIGNNEQAVEADVNSYRHFSSNSSWEVDNEVMCICTFQIGSVGNRNYFASGALSPGDVIEVEIHLITGQRQLKRVFRGNTEMSIDNRNVHKMPRILSLDDTSEIRSEFHSDDLRELEDDFLSLCFGENSIEKIPKWSESVFHQQLSDANTRINNHLAQIMPFSLGLELSLGVTRNEPIVFTVVFRDKHGGRTPIDYRGSGVQKITNLLVRLLEFDPDKEHLCILVDEPENSLHADSQHLFRSLLGSLANKEKIQVVYATHSPSMINPMKPDEIRLLERTIVDGKATTVINNKPYQNNFYNIRRSLGLTPADSLLYAPVSVIVEGPTEVICLPSVLEKLAEDNGNNDANYDAILPLIHFVDGSGSSFAKWCEMARSQGSKPIVFVDGDKIQEALKVQDKHPEVQVVHLDENEEFEDLIPRSKYFEAVSTAYDNDELSKDDYETWEAQAKISIGNFEHLMFTKRVNRWLEDRTSLSLDKPRVMKQALDLCETEEIETEKFLELIQKIEILLNG